MKKLVYGVGINDADYVVNRTITVRGAQKTMWNCPHYEAWKGMLRRCYSQEYKTKFPTYEICTVSEEWLVFSNFKQWVSHQNFREGMQLDKDILIIGNKHYSANTCCFVPKELNFLLNLNANRNSGGMIGTKIKNKGYESNITLQGTKNYLGYFSSESSAHKAWQKAKANYIESVITWYATQDCFRTDVAEALTRRVWKLRLDHSLGVETRFL